MLDCFIQVLAWRELMIEFLLGICVTLLAFVIIEVIQ
jgi:hypothetical protein